MGSSDGVIVYEADWQYGNNGGLLTYQHNMLAPRVNDDLTSALATYPEIHVVSVDRIHMDGMS